MVWGFVIPLNIFHLICCNQMLRYDISCCRIIFTHTVQLEMFKIFQDEEAGATSKHAEYTR